MTIRDRFLPYDRLETGICVIHYERESSIIFCNQHFASFLSTTPERLEGRSLDELTTSAQLHYEGMQRFLVKKSMLISMLGGCCIQVRDQSHDKAARVLKVARIDSDRFNNEIYLIGYVRRATWLELRLNKLRLDARVDPIFKPIANFFLAGRWRPIAFSTSPLWMPYLRRHWPEIHSLIESAISP